MAGFKIENFAGEVPSLGPRLLPNNFAQWAVNCDFSDGVLRGVTEPEVIAELGPSPLFYLAAWRVPKDGGHVIVKFEHRYTTFEKGPLINDTHNRYYWVEPGRPPRYRPLQDIAENEPPLLLGIPAPTTAPTVGRSGGVSSTMITRAYVYTYESAYGEEGPPSPPTVTTGKEDDDWTVSDLSSSVPDAAERNVTKVNIYRTVTALDGTATFYRIGTVDIVDLPLTFNDDMTDVDAVSQPELASTLWFPPPEDLEGIVAMSNGFFIGWRGRDIFFSEPFRPHAWPEPYRLATQFNIVGVGVFGNTAVLATDGAPEAVTGVHPSTMAMSKNTVAEPCLSRGSIVSSPEGVYYASQNGLVQVGPDGIVNITKKLIGKETWIRRYSPQEIQAARYERRFIAITAPGRGFFIDLDDEKQAFTEFDSIPAAVSVRNDPWTGDVFIIANKQLMVWAPDVGERVPGRWRSKEFVFDKPINLGAMETKAEGGDMPPPPVPPIPEFNTDPPIMTGETTPAPVHVRIWAGRRLVFDGDVQSNHVVRGPSGFKSEVWQVELLTAVPIYSFTMAETAKELGGV